MCSSINVHSDPMGRQKMWKVVKFYISVLHTLSYKQAKIKYIVFYQRNCKRKSIRKAKNTKHKKHINYFLDCWILYNEQTKTLGLGERNCLTHAYFFLHKMVRWARFNDTFCKEPRKKNTSPKFWFIWSSIYNIP